MNNLKIQKIAPKEVNRGWIRVNTNNRNNIQRGHLCKIKYIETGKSILRIMLGHDTKETIFMDLYTRDKLSTKTKKCVPTKIKKKFEIIDVNFYPWSQIHFYWNHPNFPINFATKLSIILGLLSLFLGIISLK